MKVRGAYFALLVAGFVVLALAGLKVPPRFNWEATYSHQDAQPLGCLVFDSVMTTMLPQGYRMTTKTLSSLSRDTTFKDNLLVHATQEELYSIDEESLLKLVKKGCNVCLAIPYMSQDLSKALELPERYQQFSLETLKLQVRIGERGSIRWNAQPGLYLSETYPVYSILCGSRDYQESDSKKLSKAWKVLAVFSDDEVTEIPMVLSRKYGKGTLVVCYTPALLTNYGVLDGHTAEYVMRILSQLGTGPLTRTTAYCMTVSEEPAPTPLRYFLDNAPLRWALFLTLATLLLFMVFTARRRQRPLPLPETPVNRELEFVKHIGALHAERKDYRGLLVKKYNFFAEDLLREQQLDIRDPADDGDTFPRLSSLTGLPSSELATFIRVVRRLVSDEALTVSSEEMKIYIDKMEDILHSSLLTLH